MGETTDRPLVTFALFAYNQEKYIREAVEGALSQTYEPLEIILSDDCSTDRTFEIMREVVVAYPGPHQVKLNRNRCNLGIGGHVRKIGEMASGDIVIMAAGDDISLPERTSAVAECFASHPDAFAVLSDISIIDDESRMIRRRRKSWPPSRPIPLGIWTPRRRILPTRVLFYGGGVGQGAAYAYRRKCFDWPWPYPEFALNEDRVLPLRAIILGEIWHIDHVLVKYRLSEGSVSQRLSAVQLLPALKPEHSNEVFKTLFAGLEQGFLDRNLVDLLKLCYILGEDVSKHGVELRSKISHRVAFKVIMKLTLAIFECRIWLVCCYHGWLLEGRVQKSEK